MSLKIRQIEKSELPTPEGKSIHALFISFIPFTDNVTKSEIEVFTGRINIFFPIRFFILIIFQ